MEAPVHRLVQLETAVGAAPSPAAGGQRLAPAGGLRIGQHRLDEGLLGRRHDHRLGPAAQGPQDDLVARPARHGGGQAPALGGVEGEAAHQMFPAPGE